MKIISYITPLIFTVSAHASIFESTEVKQVKASAFNLCSAHTFDDVVNGFFSNPRWQSGVSEDGDTFVNVKGGMLYMEKEVSAQIQFLIEDNMIEFNALEFNEIPQNQLVASSLFHAMCQASSPDNDSSITVNVLSYK